MIPLHDIDYLMVREAEERLASKNAAGEPARQAHAILADLYDDQAWKARDASCEEALISVET
jgi:hypothetical protein